MITFSFVLPLLCEDWVYSFFYIHSKDSSLILDRVISQNEKRVTLAETYFTDKRRIDQRLNTQNIPNRFRDDNVGVDIAIGVVTVRRTHPQYRVKYLTQVMAQLDKLRTQDRLFSEKALFICNAEPYQNNHTEADQLSEFFFVKHHNVSASVYEKEKLDYVFCIEEALKFNPRYVLIIEDDFLPSDGFFDILHNTLFLSIKESPDIDSEKSRNWAFLKLFYPERWQGYASETKPILELFGIGCIGGSFSILIYVLCHRRSSSCERGVMFILGASYFIIVCVLIGRQYVITMKQNWPSLYSLQKAPECCTPAVLYPSHHLPSLLTFLRKAKCSQSNPIDFVLDEYANNFKLRRYLVEPNLGRHIGLISSIKSLNKHIVGEFLY